MNTAITETQLSGCLKLRSGKVRDLYDAGENLVLVASDRLSAFDVIMEQGIPDKGKILTSISNFWFEKTKDIIANHIISDTVDDFPNEFVKHKPILQGRAVLVKKSQVIPVECIVRGYISGTGWNDYQQTGCISGIELPKGLRESEKLPHPIFTPSTKADIGDHDENITVEKARKIMGHEVFEKVESAAISVFNRCSEYALERDIILADTKMEFGITDGGEIILIDELLTPDSSRFWDLNEYEVGRSQKSFDKQFVRDYPTSINFNKRPPAPLLPESVIEGTKQKYLEVYKLLTGNDIQL